VFLVFIAEIVMHPLGIPLLLGFMKLVVKAFRVIEGTSSRACGLCLLFHASYGFGFGFLAERLEVLSSRRPGGLMMGTSGYVGFPLEDFFDPTIFASGMPLCGELNHGICSGLGPDFVAIHPVHVEARSLDLCVAHDPQAVQARRRSGLLPPIRKSCMLWPSKVAV
jgi:hypothetical protein